MPAIPRLKRNPRPKGPPLKEQLWNVPNVLTYFRIMLIPVIVVILYGCRAGADPAELAREPRLLSFWACAILAIASITDFFDGWIARNWGMSTTVGQFLDPLADKLLVVTCLVMTVHLERVPAWFVALLICRELSITSLRSIATNEGLEIEVARTGKWKTAFQMLGLVGVLIHYEYLTDFIFYEAVINYNRVGMCLLIMSMVFSIISAVQYFSRFAVAAAAHDSEDPTTSS